MLPLAQVKTRLFGNTLIPAPFCVYGGPLAADAESAAALAAHAAALLRADRRQRAGVPRSATRHERRPSGWVERPDLYVTFRKPIEADHERNLKAIPRKQRAMVRKGIQNGLTSVVDRDVGRAASDLRRERAQSRHAGVLAPLLPIC